jgi:hypothetical protein
METRTRTTRNTEIAARLALSGAFALAALIVAGCGGGNSRRSAAEGACVGLLEFENREYVSEAMRDAMPALAGPAGTAVMPGCNDVVPSTTTESSTNVNAFELEGIPVERALAVEDQADIVYVARGICDGETTPASLVACLRRG